MAEMTGIDLDALSRENLVELRKSIDRMLDSYDTRMKVEAHAKVEALARELGFSLAELVDFKLKAKAPRGSGIVKYRHPDNQSLAWSGRGRRPRWFTDAISGGLTSEDLAVS
jgi:DNA-binding protein H-NS